MALEQELAALRDEMQKLTAVTTKLLETRVEAIETVRSAAAPAPKPAAAAKKDAEKPAPEKTEATTETAPVKEVEKPAPEKKAAAEAQAEDDLSDDALKAHVAYYVNFGTSDDAPLTKEEREARMTKVRGVLDHEKIKAKTVAEVPQNARKAFRKKINEFIAEIEASGQLTAPAEAAAGEVDDL